MTNCVWLVDEGRQGRGFNLGRVIQNGERAGQVQPHWGVDIQARRGTPVRAVRDGTVLWVGNRLGYGITVAIRHADNLSTFYAHLQSALVARGQEVHPGDIVGRVGDTTAGPGGQEPEWAIARQEEGRPMGPHLHWEVHPRARPDLGRRVTRSDPVAWLHSNNVAIVRSQCPNQPAVREVVTCQPAIQSCMPTFVDRFIDEWYEEEEDFPQCIPRGH